MDFAWTEAQSALYEDALAFGREVDSAIAGRERGNRPYFEREDWARCGEFGLAGLSVPERYGGRGLDALTTARTIEGFAQGCTDAGLVFSLCAHLFACAMPIVESGSEDLKERVLPRLASGEWIGANAITEPDSGSDAFSLTTRAARDGDGYSLTGTKSFVTNGPIADCFVAYATTEPAHGYLGVTGFVIERDRPGITVGEHFDKVGLRTTPVSSVEFDRCVVDAANLLGTEGTGAAVFNASMLWERACLFAQYTGALERQLEDAVAFARQRKQFGKTISRNQAISHRIADMKLRLDAGRLLLYRACWLKDQGEDAAVAISLAKLAVSEGAIRSGLDAIQIHGGLGVKTEAGVEQGLRDAIPSTIMSGTSEIQRDLVARGLGL